MGVSSIKVSIQMRLFLIKRFGIAPPPSAHRQLFCFLCFVNRTTRLISLAQIMSVPLNASREKAQAAAGYNEIQWDRFKVCMLTYSCLIAHAIQRFTKVEVLVLVEKSPDRKWKEVPADEAMEIKDRINSLLAKEKIPAVQDNVLKWRMTSCLHYHCKS
jgi:hypothetical protein